MTSLAIVTPSFAPDFELCADLRQSLLAFAGDTVDHHIVVPRRDLALFGKLRGPKTHIHCVTDFLPPRFVAASRNTWINLSHPFPPVRGWVTQQMVKLAVAAAVDCDVVLLVDSDMRFVRPIAGDSFRRDGVVAFYRKAAEVDERLPQHLVWHEVSRHLLGLAPPPPPPLPNYICWPSPRDPAIVRSLLAKVEEVSGRAWMDALAAQPHFSEEMLYGIFVDELIGAPATSFASADMRCHSYSGEEPLDEMGMLHFLSGVKTTDLAVMISGNSGTPLELRRAALHAFAQ